MTNGLRRLARTAEGVKKKTGEMPFFFRATPVYARKKKGRSGSSGALGVAGTDERSCSSQRKPIGALPGRLYALEYVSARPPGRNRPSCSPVHRHAQGACRTKCGRSGQTSMPMGGSGVIRSLVRRFLAPRAAACAAPPAQRSSRSSVASEPAAACGRVGPH